MLGSLQIQSATQPLSNGIANITVTQWSTKSAAAAH
jgi:hypothetical protein